MDPKTFGAFIADVRKEKNLTQAELAGLLHVTDKAVSRWERGLGFPDIHTFEPLAEALGLTVLELMQSERHPETTVPAETADLALANTLGVAEHQQRKKVHQVIRRFIVALAVLAALVGGWMLLSGFMPTSGIYMAEYTALPGGDALLIKVGNASSMGYVRSVRNISRDPAKMELQFYSAFGGFNSALGARNVFALCPDDACTEIYIVGGSYRRLELTRNPKTGQWEEPE